MSSSHPLVQDRTTIQGLRSTLDHRESVTTSVRMLRSVVSDRTERLGRDATPVRSDAELLEYLDDLLDVHTGGSPGLGFLSQGLSDYVSQYRSASRAGDPPEIVTRYDRLDPGPNHEPFPVELAAYVSGGAQRSDARAAFADVLGSADPQRMAALTWFLDRHLHPVAREGVDTTESNLQQARDSHVNNLQKADDPNSTTDPLSVLDWDNPVAMLPVRLETAFRDATPSGGTLKMRVYPDQLHVDTHEPELTEPEYEWGTEFWARVWFVNHDMTVDPEGEAVDIHDGSPPDAGAAPDRLPNDRLRRVVGDLYDGIADGAFSQGPQKRFEEVRDRAWRRGVEQFGTERAAYIVRELAPTHGGATIDDELLAGPDADHWRQPVEGIEEFDELPADDQVKALLQLFVTLEDVEQEQFFVLLRNETGATEKETPEDRVETVEQTLPETTQAERRRLLTRLEEANIVEDDDVDDLLTGRMGTVRRPPSLRFPDDDVAFRPASWTRPPRAQLLPDRWVVYAYWDHEGPNDVPNLQNPNSNYSQWSEHWQPAGSSAWRRWDPDREQWVKKVTGPAIREPLSVGPRPESVTGDSSDGDAGMKWMLDFGAAKTAGMGLEFSNPDDGSWDGSPGGGGYDELVVTGVRTSGDPSRSAGELEALLAAQEYTQGLSILRQGTPTNNADEPSGRSSAEDPEASAPVKVSDPLVPLDDVDRDRVVPLSGSTVTADGTRLADALGIRADRFAHVENADTLRHVDEGHANDVLWPATWGYYARNMLVPEFWNTVLGGKSRYQARSEELGWLHSTPEMEATTARVLSGWLAKFRNHFRDYVRGGGPLQTLQVGNQPYGVLPATPLSVDERETAVDASAMVDPVQQAEPTGSGQGLLSLDPESLPDEVLLSTLVDWVSSLRRAWLRSADGVPTVGDGTTTDQELLDLLSMAATPRTLRRQSWLLDDVSAVWQLFDQNSTYRGNAAGSRRNPRSNGGRAALRNRNLSHVPSLSSPRIGSMRFYGQSGILSDEDDLVDDSLPAFLRALRGTLDGGLYDPLQGDSPDAMQWLDRLRALGGYWRTGWPSGLQFASPHMFSTSTGVETPQRGTIGQWDDLVNPAGLASAHEWLSTPGDLSTSASVLRTVLHFATLREVAAARIRLGALYSDPLEMAPDPATYLDNETIYQELLTNLGAGQTSGLANHSAVANSSTGRPTYADAVRAAANDDASPSIDQFLERFGRGLNHLSGMTPDQAEERVMETLGLASHRLDAWWTSIATRQLDDIRAGGKKGTSSDGTLIGAFGYVEDLVPEPGETGEYLLAPSQNQVTTAAILRSAHRAADDPTHADSIAVDLSAERVQRARTMLAGVRNGRSVSNILGHRFEHRLRELTEADDQPNLRQYRGDFRAAAPSKGGSAGHRKGSTNETTDHSARSDVVDGRRLLRDWQNGTLWGKSELSDAASNQDVKNAVESILESFEDWLDAVNDVLTAEAVHQLSTGNPERATAALEGLSRGKQLPRLEVLRTPRRETGVNNRLMVLFGDGEWRDPGTDPPFDSKYKLRAWRNLVERDNLIDPANLPEIGGSAGQQGGGNQQGQQQVSTERTVGMRHVGEPNLNGWIGELLPQPDRVRCEASFRWSEERTFEAGTFETPTEPGVVTVTDLEFEPDVLLFRVPNAVQNRSGNPTTDLSCTGWTHGVFHAADGDHDQASTSVSTPEEGDAEYATSDGYALSIAVPDDAPTGLAVRGEVDATVTDGFQVKFDRTIDRSLLVQYQAIKTGDESAVSVGQFTTDQVSSVPATQTVDLNGGSGLAGIGLPSLSDFDPDHLLLTASNAIGQQNTAGTIGSGQHPGSLVGVCQGEAVATDSGIDQQAMTTSLDTDGDDGHAVGFQGDAALELQYGTGDAVSNVTTARVTKLGQDSRGQARFELEYQQPSGSVGVAGESAVVTYVAFESPTTETPVETTHDPAIGYAAAPENEGDSVSIDPGFDPACIEVMACPGVTASPGTQSGDGGSGLTVRETATDTAGWSHGVATGVADQGGLAETVKPVVNESSPPPYVNAVVGVGSGTRLVTVPYLDNEGAVAGRDVGRLTAMDGGGVTVEFPELHSEDRSERPVLYYRAWPTAPEELDHRTDTLSVPLDSLDVSPLDAVSLSQVDARPGLSQLEQRLRYYLFRHRPTNQPSVPDDADLELTFAETGTDDDSHVSFAEYLEAARSIRELLGEGRPVDAEDLAHPSEADDAGYLPPGSPDESSTASELRERADEVERRIDDARRIVDNRRELLAVGEDERNVCDQVDAIDRAIETFCREVPARQVHEVADRLDDTHDPTNGPRLLEELRTIVPHLRAGPATKGAVGDEVRVETGKSRTIELETDAPGEEFELTARPHSPGDHFATRTWTREAGSDGTIQLTFDATGITAGTRFTVVGRLPGQTVLRPLDPTLERYLRELSDEDRFDLFERLIQEGYLDDQEKDAIENLMNAAGVSEFPQLPVVDQIRAFLLLDYEDKRVALAMLGQEELAEQYPDHGLWTGLSDELRSLNASERRALLSELENEGWLSAEELHTITDMMASANVTDFEDLPLEDQLQAFAQLDREDKFVALDILGRGEVIQRQVLPPLSDVLERRLRHRDADERQELIEWLRDEDYLTESDVKTIERMKDAAGVQDFEDLTLADQLRAFELLDRAGKMACLVELEREKVADWYENRVVAKGPLVRTGRVLEPADGGDYTSEALEGTVGSQDLIPRLLWLDRHLEEIRPTGETAGNTLSGALDPSNTDWGQIGKERSLMSTIRPQVPEDAFGPEDFATVQRLTELQHVDLSASTGLTGKLESAIDPVDRVGLTEFVGRTGPGPRPDAQRHWKTDDCSVGDIWERHCEGSVRARLSNFLRAPGWPGAPETFARFAPEFRDLLTTGNLQPEHVFAVETILKNPSAFIEGMDQAVDEPAALLQDLNELLYHPPKLADRVTSSGLQARLESFRDWLDAGTMPSAVEIDDDGVTGLASYLRSGGIADLIQFVHQVPGMQPNQPGSSLSDQYEQDVGASLGTLRGTPTAPGSTQHTIADRVAKAYRKDDFGPPFRRGVLETLRRGLLRASYAGVYGSTPNSTAGGTTEDQRVLVDQAEVVVEALGERLDQARRVIQENDPDVVATQVDRLKALLGEDFAVLPPFAPSNPAELAHTFGHSDELLDNDPYAVDTWLQRVSRVREHPAGFRETLTYADLFDLAGDDDTAATGGSRDSIVRRSMTVGQLPHDAGTGGDPDASWVGLDGVKPRGGELSMAALFVSEDSGGSSPVSATAGKPPMAGLFVDEWVTKVPESERELGVGFRYDDPDARPPQSVVLAVPPSWSRRTEKAGIQPTGRQTWTEDTLLTTLQETTDLAKARSVDLDGLDVLGHVLPAACFPHNENSDVVPYDPELFLPDAPSVLLDTFEWDSLE